MSSPETDGQGFSIYIMTRREALEALGVSEEELASVEAEAGIEGYPGRGGYTAEEYGRLRLNVEGRRKGTERELPDTRKAALGR